MTDASEELPMELRDLLALESARDAVDPALRARLASRLETSLGLRLPHAHDPPPSAASSFTSGTPSALGRVIGASGGLAIKPLAALLLFGAGSAFGSLVTLGAQRLTRTAEHAPAAPAAPIAMPPPAAASTPTPIAPTAADSGNVKPAVVPRSAAPANPNASATGLRAEQWLVDQARSALARDRPRDALEAIELHRKRYPRGQLAEECASLSVVALARLGRTPEAERAAQQFHARYPQSMFGAMVDAALAR
jgi:hypothetical protein